MSPPYPYTYKPRSLGLKVYFDTSSKAMFEKKSWKTCAFMSDSLCLRTQFGTCEAIPGDKSSLLTGLPRILDQPRYFLEYMPRVQARRLVQLIQVKSVSTGAECSIFGLG